MEIGDIAIVKEDNPWLLKNSILKCVSDSRNDYREFKIISGIATPVGESVLNRRGCVRLSLFRVTPIKRS